jgi:hypothetical protein
MTDYVLHVMSYKGVVPWAVHFKGKVEGPSVPSCHGAMKFNSRGSGKWTCAEGHEIPDKAEWQVEAAWDEDRYERYAAGHFEDAGPSQFLAEEELLAAARARFLGEIPAPRGWEDKAAVAGQPGDRLFYAVLPENSAPEDQRPIDLMADAARREAGLPAWGDLVAEVPQAEDGGRFYVTVIRNPGPRQKVGRLLGPYRTRAEAEGRVDDARRLAAAEDPDTAFDGFGVSKWDRAVKSGEWLPGALNGRLAAERAAAAAEG